MFRSKIANFLALFVIAIASISAAGEDAADIDPSLTAAGGDAADIDPSLTGAGEDTEEIKPSLTAGEDTADIKPSVTADEDTADIEPSVTGNEEDGNFEKYDKMEPLSVFKQTEVLETIVNKTFELKVYSKTEDSDDKMDKEPLSKKSLIAKLIISETTKVLKNGIQVGSVKIESHSIILNGEQIAAVVPEQVPEEVKEINKTEIVSPPITNPEPEKVVETGSSEEVEEEVKEEETEKEDSESPVPAVQPAVVVPTKEVEPENIAEKNTSSSENATKSNTQHTTSALKSSAVGMYGLLFNNIVLLLPILIGLSYV